MVMIFPGIMAKDLKFSSISFQLKELGNNILYIYFQSLAKIRALCRIISWFLGNQYAIQPFVLFLMDFMDFIKLKFNVCQLSYVTGNMAASVACAQTLIPEEKKKGRKYNGYSFFLSSPPQQPKSVRKLLASGASATS